MRSTFFRVCFTSVAGKLSNQHALNTYRLQTENRQVPEIKKREDSMKRSCIMLLVVLLAASPGISLGAVGQSDNGLMTQEWYLDLNYIYGWDIFGATSALLDLDGVNSYGGEPDRDLEIVTGSDGYYQHVNPSLSVPGLWRTIDSRGNVEWYKNTESDEARGSVAVADINGDGYPEIAGGTTSGHTIEVMDRFGNFIWTFPDPPSAGGAEWPTAPALADINSGVTGMEVIAVHRPTCTVVALDGDNSDGMNDGIEGTGIPYYSWSGQDGVDWDVLWSYVMTPNYYYGDCNGSAAIGDIDNDGVLEVVAGSQTGGLYILDGATGILEQSFSTGSIQATPSLANLDTDPQLEIVVGDLNGDLFVFSWDGAKGTQKAVTNLGSVIYSSAALGTIDDGGTAAIVVGTGGGKVYAFDGALNQKWVYPAEGQTGFYYASPTLFDARGVRPYDVQWQMFKHDSLRTGFYGPAPRPLDVVIGSMDAYVYVINGDDGTLIDKFQTSGPIHGSPSVGDIDGDGKLNIINLSWGQYGGYTPYDRLWNIELAKMNEDPVADAGPDQTVACGGTNGTTVTLDGAGSSDPDGDSLIYTWTWNGGSASGVNPTVVLPLGATTVTLTVDDNNGATAEDTMVVTVFDSIPPVTLSIIGGISGNNGWYTSDVTVTLEASDNCSGVKEVHYSVDGVETVVPGAVASLSLTTEGTHNVTYFAKDNAENPGTAHGLSCNIDKTAPAISINDVADGATYPLCSAPNPTYTVLDEVSGMSSHNAVLTGGNENGVNFFTYTVTATDNAGNTATKSVTYRVSYEFGGFLPPVTLDRPFKKGSTIPVKFTLGNGCGAIVPSVAATLTLQLVSGTEPVGDPIDATSNVPDSGNLFRYSSTDGIYIYNLATSDLVTGTYIATVTTDDGVTRTVNIQIKQ